MLTKAANSETVDHAHPAFVSMIERMSIDEAKIISYLWGKGSLPYIHFRSSIPNENVFNDELKYLTELSSLELIFPDNGHAYLSNLIALGILADRDPFVLKPESRYDNLKNIHSSTFVEKTEQLKALKPNYITDWHSSFFEITAFG